ncbi:MAG: aminomethyl-transferring glycine dehydrogenase subunit GcvPA [Solirubrobacteraceae bacterium]
MAAGDHTSYVSATDSERAEMLARIGVASVEELFADIPAGLRRTERLEIPAGLPETAVHDHLRAMAARNVSAEDEISFLGAGMYDHYVPALVDAIITRSEFLTPYTPYQPEISQGGLQVMFEYQTAISELTGLPVSNASVYEGPSAVAAAGYLAKLANGRPRHLISRGAHPHSRETLATLAHGYGTSVEEIPLEQGLTDLAALESMLSDDVGAVIVQQPNFLGAVEDLEALAALAKAHGALVVASCDPIPLGLLRSPGECGVDVAVGEGQTLGNRLDFGGPSFGFFAASEEHIRRMPGRIAGETTDVDGRRGFVLTLQTREQHIRREKATSNICTAQALNALAGVIYLSWLGREGLVELGELLVRRTSYARDALGAIDGVEPLHSQPVVREFAVSLGVGSLEAARRVADRCAAQGMNPGFLLGADYPEYPDGLLVALTERRTRADIDRLAEALGAALEAERAGAPAPAGVGA